MQDHDAWKKKRKELLVSWTGIQWKLQQTGDLGWPIHMTGGTDNNNNKLQCLRPKRAKAIWKICAACGKLSQSSGDRLHVNCYEMTILQGSGEKFHLSVRSPTKHWFKLAGTTDGHKSLVLFPFQSLNWIEFLWLFVQFKVLANYWNDNKCSVSSSLLTLSLKDSSRSIYEFLLCAKKWQVVWQGSVTERRQ